MKLSYGLANGTNEIRMLSQVPSELHTDGRTSPSLSKSSVWERSAWFQGGQTLLPDFSPGAVCEQPASNSAWMLVINVCGFAFLIRS